MQAAQNALSSLSKRDEAWRKQYIHTVVTELVLTAAALDCDIVAFEDLTDSRGWTSAGAWTHVWTFRRLSVNLSYKIAEQGVSAEHV